MEQGGYMIQFKFWKNFKEFSVLWKADYQTPEWKKGDLLETPAVVQVRGMVTWRWSDKWLDSGHTLKVKPTGFPYILDKGYKINYLNNARKNNSKNIFILISILAKMEITDRIQNKGILITRKI